MSFANAFTQALALLGWVEAELSKIIKKRSGKFGDVLI